MKFYKKTREEMRKLRPILECGLEPRIIPWESAPRGQFVVSHGKGDTATRGRSDAGPWSLKDQASARSDFRSPSSAVLFS